MKKTTKAEDSRPYPPHLFVDNPDFKPYIRIIPAEGVHEWLHAEILSDDGNLHNPDHAHLLESDPDCSAGRWRHCSCCGQAFGTVADPRQFYNSDYVWRTWGAAGLMLMVKQDINLKHGVLYAHS